MSDEMNERDEARARAEAAAARIADLEERTAELRASATAVLEQIRDLSLAVPLGHMRGTVRRLEDAIGTPGEEGRRP